MTQEKMSFFILASMRSQEANSDISYLLVQIFNTLKIFTIVPVWYCLFPQSRPLASEVLQIESSKYLLDSYHTVANLRQSYVQLLLARG